MTKYYVVGKEVLGKGYAAVSDGQQVSIKEAGSTKEAVALAIKDLLNGAVSLNSNGLAPVMTNIYAVDTVGKPMSYGLVGDWMRTGKTSKGNVIKQEELVAIRDAYMALTERSFNARIISIGDISKSDLNNKTMVQNTWAALDRHIATLTPCQTGIALGLGTQQPAMGLGNAQNNMQGMPSMDANMMQMFQQFMTMMGGGMQQPMMQQQQVMPTVAPQTVQEPEQPVLGTPICSGNPLATDLEDPTKLNVSLNVGEQVSNNTDNTNNTIIENTTPAAE